MSLSLGSVLYGLSAQTKKALTRQQTAPPHHRDTGAIIRADWGVGEPGATAGFVALLLWTHVLRQTHSDLFPPEPATPPNNGTPSGDEETKAALLALDFLERSQRLSGLTDLRDCNYDSSPDAGFILQAICPPLLLLAQTKTPLDGDWLAVAERLTVFARKLTEGARTGGFHTPNHRWVLAGALHLAGPLFPDIAVRPIIEAYLAEGIDLDDDGFYIERSAGVYDAICARSLFLLHRPEVSRLVCRNLRADSFLLNADGTVETGLSNRQDKGITPTFAANLAVPFMLAHFSGGEAESEANEAGRFADLARFLWDATPANGRDYYGMSQVLIAHNSEPPPLADEMPALELLPPGVRHFPQNGLWRWRDGIKSASVFRDQTRLLNFRFGAAFLASVSIHQSYFGVGQFLTDTMEITQNENANGPWQVRLLSGGQRNPRRPGYDQPLNRPVAPADWAEARKERSLRRLPPAASELLINGNAEGGLRLHYRTLDGLNGVCSQIALDFPVGGVWETDDTQFEPQAGQVIFLKSGWGVMRYQNSGEQIRIGPGADAHRMVQMRDAAPPASPHLVRVLIALETPVSHEFSIIGEPWP